MLGDTASCKLSRHASRRITSALYATLRAEQPVLEICFLPGLNGENHRKCHKRQRELRVSAGTWTRSEAAVKDRPRIAGAAAPRSRTSFIASSLNSRLRTIYYSSHRIPAVASSNLKRFLENQEWTRVLMPFLLHSDIGLVFTSRYQTWKTRSSGLQQDFTSPQTHQQSGMVERVTRKMGEQGRSCSGSRRCNSPCAQLATGSAFTTTADRIEQWSSTATCASSMPPPATESRESMANYCAGRRIGPPIASAIGAHIHCWRVPRSANPAGPSQPPVPLPRRRSSTRLHRARMRKYPARPSSKCLHLLGST
jgi:hypothetical protein